MPRKEYWQRMPGGFNTPSSCSSGSASEASSSNSSADPAASNASTAEEEGEGWAMISPTVVYRVYPLRRRDTGADQSKLQLPTPFLRQESEQSLLRLDYPQHQESEPHTPESSETVVSSHGWSLAVEGSSSSWRRSSFDARSPRSRLSWRRRTGRWMMGFL